MRRTTSSGLVFLARTAAIMRRRISGTSGIGELMPERHICCPSIATRYPLSNSRKIAAILRGARPLSTYVSRYPAGYRIDEPKTIATVQRRAHHFL
jgi:hypothetical protein